jgi:hypothetical protein
LTWTAAWANGSNFQWIEVAYSSGNIPAGEKRDIPVHISFPISMANQQNSQPSKHGATLMVRIGDQFEMIKVDLTTNAGLFNFSTSMVEPALASKGIVGQPFEWRLHTKDRFGQPRPRKIEGGPTEIKLKVNKAWCASKCSSSCVDHICGDKNKFCCQDNDDGTYTLRLTPTSEGSYKIRASTGDHYFRFGESDSTELQVEQMKAAATTCGSMVIQQTEMDGASASQLSISIHNTSARPKLLISRADASRELNNTGDTNEGSWTYSEGLQIGGWQVEYRYVKLHAPKWRMYTQKCVCGYADLGVKFAIRPL